MNGLFSTYFKLGYQHILDVNGYDHIVFIVALCAIYTWKEWKQVAILVTAFTIGHSLTLALAVLDVIRFPQDLIETLIPITILLTCIANIFVKNDKTVLKDRIHYVLALCFGFIHGMGFSNFLRSSLMPGENSIVRQLFAFNVGLEIGQLCIVGMLFGMAFLMVKYIKMPQREWTVFLSGLAFGIALVLLLG